jgi:hypothetical protein
MYDGQKKDGMTQNTVISRCELCLGIGPEAWVRTWVVSALPEYPH